MGIVGTPLYSVVHNLPIKLFTTEYSGVPTMPIQLSLYISISLGNFKCMVIIIYAHIIYSRHDNAHKCLT